MRSQFFSIVILGMLFSSFKIFSTNYHIGPGQAYPELGDVPWITLTAGDTVFIHWRSTPYAEKIFLRAQGTDINPVVIRGVPNANGELPVITGENAVTNAQFSGYFDSQWTEDLGLFLIGRGPNDDYYNYNPQNIVIEYLELTGIKPSNTFTDQYGNTRQYNEFSSAIHVLVADNLTIRHCKIHDNAQGIFTNSSGTTEGEISRNTLIEYNEIWGNGNADADGTEHNIYIQSAGTIIQYNYFGSPRAGSVGANIKDRSSGTVIRYNWIEGAARILDLVETEDAAAIIMNEPDYHDVYVYGNIITNYLTNPTFGTNLIHYGYDNSPFEAKRGTLYFYNNTVYIEGDEDDWWDIKLFDIPDDQDPTTSEGTVALYNNIIHVNGTTHLKMMRDGGTIAYYANNWIQEGYEDLGYGATAAVTINTPPVTGINPGFNDTNNEDFTLIYGSPCIDASGSFPSNITNYYPLDRQYVKHANSITRTQVGVALDLGAFEFGMTTGINDKKQVKFILFPVPAQQFIGIRGETKEITGYKIYDIQGKVVGGGKLPGNNLIDISFLSPANYYIQLILKGDVVIRKFVKY